MATRQYIGARYVPKFADPIQWDINQIYEPLTMVTYLNNTYTSKKPVPQGIDINNKEYWALTGNYNAQVEEYRQKVEEYANQVDEYVKAPKIDVATPTPKRYYIDCVDGDDNNDGSSDHPWKTITRFFKQANNTGRIDNRCYIVREGVYETDIFSITSCSLHITPRVEGVTIRFTYPDGAAIYNCYMNIGASNIPMNLESVGPTYADNTLINANFVNINWHFHTYGGGLQLADGSCMSCDFNKSKVRFSRVKIIPVYDKAQFNLEGCDMKFTSTFYPIEMSKDSEYPLISCSDSKLTLNNTPVSTGGKYSQIIKSNNSIILANRARLMNIKANGISSAISEYDNPSLAIDNVIYPTPETSDDIWNVGEYNLNGSLLGYNMCYIYYLCDKTNEISVFPVCNYARNVARNFNIKVVDPVNKSIYMLKGTIGDGKLTITDNKIFDMENGFAVSDNDVKQNGLYIRAVYVTNI